MAKLDFSKYSIEYNGSNYKIHTKGDDAKGAGGIWDMAGAFAEDLLYELDGGAFCDGDLTLQSHATIQEHAYNLIKHGVVDKLRNQLGNQREVNFDGYKITYGEKQYSLEIGDYGTADGDLEDFAGAFADDVCNQVYGDPSDASAIGFELIKAGLCDLLSYYVLPQLSEQINNSTNLKKCKVAYGNKQFSLNVSNDETADGNLNDFAGAFANDVCDYIYGQDNITEKCRNAYAIIYGEIQYLLESIILGQLQKHLKNQSEM